jgi:mono/diheme cytochrome c family protein
VVQSFVLRTLLVTIVAVAGGIALLFADITNTTTSTASSFSGERRSGLAAWDSVYSVLTHPRCINCHTATNYPQQGDDRRRHFANVVRGPEGKGVAGLNCISCHQERNADATGVPGAHGWHLAPLSMRWQDLNDRQLSSAQVCRALLDRKRNHGLDGPGIVKHHQEEALVNALARLTGKRYRTPPIITL